MNQFHRMVWFSSLVGLLAAGCATQRIDWAARVGNYTYDQAVMDFGPPDKSAKLTDGTMVAEWLTRRGYTSTYSAFGYSGYGPYCYGPFYPGYPAYTEVTPDYYLRLIFDPDGELKAWKKFSK